LNSWMASGLGIEMPPIDKMCPVPWVSMLRSVGTAFGVGYLMGFSPGVKAFAAAVLGGIGNIRGAMLGGLLLGLAETLIPAIPAIGTQWTEVVAFVVLVLVLMFRPTGILGERLGRAA